MPAVHSVSLPPGVGELLVASLAWGLVAGLAAARSGRWAVRVLLVGTGVLAAVTTGCALAPTLAEASDAGRPFRLAPIAFGYALLAAAAIVSAAAMTWLPAAAVSSYLLSAGERRYPCRGGDRPVRERRHPLTTHEPDMGTPSRAWAGLVKPDPWAVPLAAAGRVVTLLAVAAAGLTVLAYGAYTGFVPSAAYRGELFALTGILSGVAVYLARSVHRRLTPRWPGRPSAGRRVVRLAASWGLGLAGAAAVLYAATWELPAWLVVAHTEVVLALSPAAWGVLLLFRLGRRLRAPNALRVLLRDRRPPILLLRSFRDDGARVEAHSAREPFWASWAVGARPVVTFEELLCDLFGRHSPVVAIGRPGELVSPLGAARAWVRNDAAVTGEENWQKVVRDLIAESQYVVMIMGSIEGRKGLTWEVETLFAAGHHEKVVLVVPPLPEEAARAVWEGYRPLTGDRLPAYRGGVLMAAFTRDGVCVTEGRAAGRQPRDRDYRDALAYLTLRLRFGEYDAPGM